MYLGLLFVAITTAGVMQSGRSTVGIIDGPKANISPISGPTEFDAGPAFGNILNYHFFPGMQDYGVGKYSYAAEQMNYVVTRPGYLDGNPKQHEYLSSAHYIRGMIYSHHATGVGRFQLAKADFEAAVKWNPKNYVAYLELSRVYSQLDLNDFAVKILRHLLDLRPDQAIAEEAGLELKKLGKDPGEAVPIR